MAIEALICCDWTLYFLTGPVFNKKLSFVTHYHYVAAEIEEDLIIMKMRNCPLETPVSPLIVGTMRWSSKLGHGLRDFIRGYPA